MLVSKGKEVGTLPHLTAGDRIGRDLTVPRSLRKGVQVLPLARILRAVEQNRSTDFRETRTHADKPGIALFPRKRVAEPDHLHAWRWSADDGLGEFAPCSKVRIARCGDALDLAQALIPNRLLFCGDFGDACIDNAGALAGGQDTSSERSVRIKGPGGARESDGQMIPMDHVRAHRVVPASTAEASVIEHVILTSEQLRRAWIADEACLRKQVKLRAEWILHQPVAKRLIGCCSHTLSRLPKGR